MIHTWSWITWTISALAVLSITRNPIYLLIAWLCITILSTTLSRKPGHPQPLFSPLKFTGVVVILSACLNMAMSHFGATVLFKLPDHLPLIGGAFTLEAWLYGAINGLALAGIFSAFSVTNQALPVQALIRLIPRAFYPVAVVTSIAITFVPTTLRQFKQIREAQAVRGHRLRGLQDWLPLLMPLLIGGLERALALAEAMTARGFAQSTPRSPHEYIHRLLYRLALLACLAIILTGWIIHLANLSTYLGAVMLMTGAVGIIGALWRLGQHTRRTIYTRESFHWGDIWILVGSLATLINFVIPLPGLAYLTRAYNPYPVFQLPPVDGFGAILITGLLAPLVVLNQWRLNNSKQLENQESPVE